MLSFNSCLLTEALVPSTFVTDRSKLSLYSAVGEVEVWSISHVGGLVGGVPGGFSAGVGTCMVSCVSHFQAPLIAVKLAGVLCLVSCGWGCTWWFFYCIHIASMQLQESQCKNPKEYI